jgi:hypothetical protein
MEATAARKVALAEFLNVQPVLYIILAGIQLIRKFLPLVMSQNLKMSVMAFVMYMTDITLQNATSTEEIVVSKLVSKASTSALSKLVRKD